MCALFVYYVCIMYVGSIRGHFLTEYLVLNASSCILAEKTPILSPSSMLQSFEIPLLVLI